SARYARKRNRSHRGDGQPRPGGPQVPDTVPDYSHPRGLLPRLYQARPRAVRGCISKVGYAATARTRLEPGLKHSPWRHSWEKVGHSRQLNATTIGVGKVVIASGGSLREVRHAARARNVAEARALAPWNPGLGCRPDEDDPSCSSVACASC